MTNTKIKLLLPAEDGAIPFLTPYLLNKYFSPNEQLIKDHLVVGMSIKDTCIQPIFPKKSESTTGSKNDSSNDSKNTESESSNTNTNTTTETDKEPLSKTQQKKLKKRKMKEAAAAAAKNNEKLNDNKRQRTTYNGDASDKENEKKEKNYKDINTATMKPIGYAFDDTSDIQSLLAIPGYNTIIVPTFDLIDDVMKFTKKSQSEKKNSNKDKSDTSSSSSSSDLPSISIATNNNQVTLCTPHGMQKLTAGTYTKIVSNVQKQQQSHSIVGLYDQVYTNDKMKRKVSCIERTKAWMSQLITSNSNSNSDNNKAEQMKIWSPLVCNAIEIENQDANPNDNDNANTDDNSNNNDDGPSTSTSTTYKNTTTTIKAVLKSIHDQHIQEKSITGVAMVGWHHIPSRETRVNILQQCSTSLTATPVPTTYTSLDCAVLVTNNLKQILDVTRYGGSMFGCHLLAQWSRSNKALGISLSSKEDKDMDMDTVKVPVAQLLDEDGCMDLSNSIYFQDKSPLVEGCQCFACKDGTYTRSYVHHLIHANELLADIVLFGHNLYQMLLLCEKLSFAHDHGNIDKYCQFIENQLGLSNKKN